MSKPRPTSEELEKAIEDVLIDAEIPRPAAIPLARLAAYAMCRYLNGNRVTFGKAIARSYRNRAIYEESTIGNSDAIASAERLSSSTIRKIVKKQRKVRSQNDKL